METTSDSTVSTEIPIWTAPGVDDTTASATLFDGDIPLWDASDLSVEGDLSSWGDSNVIATWNDVASGDDLSDATELQHVPSITYDPMADCFLDNSRIRRPKRWRVLSVDGGGLRGVIPATILTEIWKATGRRPLHENFQIMTGNSVGGLTVCGLNIPDEDGNPLYTPEDLLETFTQEKDTIFPKSWFNIGLTGPRYPADGIESVIKKYMGETRMRDLLATEVVCPSFCTRCDKMEYFSKIRSQMDMKHSNDLAWEAVRATTAAPTYFPSFQRNGCNLIDGFMQNDTVHLAYWRAVKLGADPRRMTVLSLGTGRVDCSWDTSNWGLMDWAPNLVEVVCKGQSDGSQLIVDDILGGAPSHQYYRVQPTITADLQAFDDTDDDKITRRIEAAEEWLENNDEIFREIVMQCEPAPSDDNE